MSGHRSFHYFSYLYSCFLAFSITAILSFNSPSFGTDKAETTSWEESNSLLIKGSALYYQHQFAQAVDILSQAIANSRDTKILYSALVHRGAARGYLKQREKALKDFDDALKINNQDPFLYYMRAVAVFSVQKELDRAIEDLNQALQLHPNSPLALSIYLSRCDYYARKKEFDLARDDLKQALRLDYKAANLVLQTGISAYYQNQFEWALEALTQVIANRSDDDALYSALIHRGSARGYLKQKEKALRDFEDALKINNQDPFLYYMRAVAVFAAQKEFDQAIEDLNQALQLHPNSPLALSIYLSRCDYYAQKKEFNLARDDLSHALRIDPHNKAIYATMKSMADLYAAKGDILKRKGQYNEALQYYSEAILLNPHNDRSFSGRAFTRILMRDKKGAISDLQKACHLGHQNACYISEILTK